MTLTATPAARDRARQRWRALAQRLQSVPPEAVAKGAIALAVIGLAGSLAVGTWPALLPFLVGAVIAYAVLPIANRLDRFMPRVLAAIVAELVAVAILVGLALLVIPPLLNGIVRVVERLPTAAEVEVGLANLQGQLGSLPDPLGGILLAVATEATANLGEVLNGLVEGAGAFVTDQILGIFGTATFLLGLLVIPAWILTIVADERSIKQRGAALITPAARGDVAALFRIVDRAMGTFLRVRVLLGIVVGLLIWAGLMVCEQLGIATFPYAVTAAVLLGSLQLIPELGFVLGFLPIALVLVIGGPVPAGAVAIVYVAATRIASGLVETRVSRGVLDVHPGLMIPAIVVLSGFGPLWLLAAAPVVAILRDVVRYTTGRLGDPPAPANVLPGERVKRPRGVAAAAVPAVYRDRAARRGAPSAIVPATSSAPSATSVPVARTFAFTPATPKPSTTVTQRSPQS